MDFENSEFRDPLSLPAVSKHGRTLVLSETREGRQCWCRLNSGAFDARCELIGAEAQKSKAPAQGGEAWWRTNLHPTCEPKTNVRRRGFQTS
jgi:hypothetical protein